MEMLWSLFSFYISIFQLSFLKYSFVWFPKNEYNFETYCSKQNVY